MDYLIKTVKCFQDCWVLISIANLPDDTDSICFTDQIFSVAFGQTFEDIEGVLSYDWLLTTALPYTFIDLLGIRYRTVSIIEPGMYVNSNSTRGCGSHQRMLRLPSTCLAGSWEIKLSSNSISLSVEPQQQYSP